MIRVSLLPISYMEFPAEMEGQKNIMKGVRIDLQEISMAHLLAPDLTADRKPSSRRLQFPGLPERQYSNQSGDVLR